MSAGVHTQYGEARYSELVLELMRATDTGNAYAFMFTEQTYVRRFENGASKSAGFPWDNNLLARLAVLQQVHCDPATTAWLGEELGIFLEKLGWRQDEHRILQALADNRAVQITLRLGAAELYALPWELVPLGTTGQALGSVPGCLIRYEWPATSTAMPKPNPPPEGGRILFAWSAAGGAVPAAQHLTSIRRACHIGHHSFSDTTDVVPHVSLKSLREALRAQPVAVLHILCHGGRVRSTTEAHGLILDARDEAGEEVIDSRSLQHVLAEHVGTLRLVVLCACHGGHSGALDSRLGSVAQELHRIGIPAVVSSRYPLSLEASISLCETLYHELLVDMVSLERAFLAARSSVSERCTPFSGAMLELYARSADGPEHWPIVHRPYRGLLAFHEEHARYFFGRHAELAEALRKLTALIEAKSITTPRFLLILGASGRGKSSIVLAGIAPALREQDPRWTTAYLRPSDAWESTLAAALSSRSDRSHPLLLIVDQLEELFTEVSHRDARDAFMQELWRLSLDAESGVSIVATLRVDLLSRCGEINLDLHERSLEDVAHLESHRISLLKMKASELREVIERPAQRVGLDFEPGLAKQIFRDTGSDPGALPLLEYALDQIWHRRRGHLLTWDAYHEIGGVGAALERRADALIDGWDDVRQRTVRRLLGQLISASTDSTFDKRSRIPITALRRGPTLDSAVFDEILEALARERLIALSEMDQLILPTATTAQVDRPLRVAKNVAMVEIAHEELIRAWKRLSQWVKEDRRMLIDLQQLATWVEEAKSFPGSLLDGEKLRYAQEVLSRYADEIDDQARQFIGQSCAAATRKRRRAHGVKITASVAAIIVLGLLVRTLRQQEAVQKAESDADLARGVAEEQATRARDAYVVMGARQLLIQQQPLYASKLLLEVSNPERTRWWPQLAHQCLTSIFSRSTLQGHLDAVVAAVFSPDGERIVTASADRTARVWNANGNGASIVLRGHGDGIFSATFSPDGKRVVTASLDNTARVWGTDSASETVVLRGHQAGVVSAAFSPDGTRVVTASLDHTARVWRADGSGDVIVLKGHRGALTAAAFSPDGKRVVTASADATARVWSADGRTAPVVLRGHEGFIASAAFSPDGKRIVTASVDKTARVWNSDGTGEVVVLPGHEHVVSSAAFSADGKRLVTASFDRTARVWAVDDIRASVVLKGHESAITSVAIDSSGRRVLTASVDKTARVWNADGSGEAIVLRGHEDEVSFAAFRPDGERIVTSSRDKTARVWRTDGTSEPSVLRGHEWSPDTVVYSPDGNKILSASRDRTVRIWSSDGSGDPIVLKHGAAVMSADFSADGKRVVAASVDGNAYVWNANGFEGPIILSGHDGPVWSAAFSLDGKYVATASADKTARIWTIDNMVPPVVLRGHDGIVSAVAFSPAGKRVVTVSELSSSENIVVQVWNADGHGGPTVLEPVDDRQWPNGKRIMRTVGPKCLLWSADETEAPLLSAGGPCRELNSDASRILTDGPDGTVSIRNVGGIGEALVLRGHTKEISFFAFTSDGNRVITASSDGTTRVWSASGIEDALILQTRHDSFSEVIVGVDGHYVVTSAGNFLHIWSASVESLRRSLLNATTDCLSPTMRRTYLGQTDNASHLAYQACERSYGRASTVDSSHWPKNPPAEDRDGDGIKDDEDECPSEPEDLDGFQDTKDDSPPDGFGCPDADNDNDGFLDTDDQCRDDPEDRDGDEDDDGCPEGDYGDRDGDGITDRIDKCPDDPEDRDLFQDKDGCPDPDNDKDAIPDAADECPNEPEDEDNYKDDDGCPD